MAEQPSQTPSGTSKHTPGPWHIVSAADPKEKTIKFVYGGFVGGDCAYGTIATTSTTDYSDEVRAQMADANARLIAAAPDLLAACEAAIETLKRLQADGYLDNGGPSVPGSAEPEWPWYLSKFETDAKAAISKATGGEA